MRNVILKSFENFIAQPLGILRKKIIRIANLKADFLDSKSVNVELLDDSVQVTLELVVETSVRQDTGDG